MSAIRVTSEELQAVAAQLGRGSVEVAQQLGAMESRVRGLVDAEWTGAASDAFRDLWDQWQRGAGDLREALDGISRMLGQAARAYQDTEDQLAGQLRG